MRTGLYLHRLGIFLILKGIQRKGHISAWKNKADWYDLDFLYLEEYPDFRAFNIYENATKEELSNDFMEEFPDYAFENRREYICGFYRSDNHGDLHREYKYLTKERAERFVKETVDIIMDALDTRNDGERAIGE